MPFRAGAAAPEASSGNPTSPESLTQGLHDARSGVVMGVFQEAPSAHIESEAAVRIDVTKQQRRQSAPVRLCQTGGPRLICQHALDHQRVDVGQTNLKQV